MTELWRLAGADQALAGERDTSDDTARRMLEAERDSLAAEAKALQTLNTELQRHRASAERSLAEARALLARREAALEEERAAGAAREQALAHVRIDLEVALERQRLAPMADARRRQPPGVRKQRPVKGKRPRPKGRDVAAIHPSSRRALKTRLKGKRRMRKKTRSGRTK
jgi:hypothetical protein